MSIVKQLIEISIIAGILFLVILLVKWGFNKKLSPKLTMLIWGILIARLLIPVTIDSPIHFIVLPEKAPTALTTTQEKLPETKPTLPIDESTVERSAEKPAAPTANSFVNQDSTASPAENKKAVIGTVTKDIDWWNICLYVWLSGVALYLLYIIALYAYTRNKINTKAEPVTQHLQNLLLEVKEELNVKRKVKLICQSEYGSPASLFPNLVLMPNLSLISATDEQIKNMLRHELIHIKRNHHLLALLLTVLNVVYWFNPIIWIAVKLIRDDIEVVCDSEVVKDFSAEEKGIYAETLLKVFSKTKYIVGAIAFGKGDSKNIAKKRIMGVFMKRNSSNIVRVFTALLALVLFVTCFTTACKPTTQSNKHINTSNQNGTDLPVAVDSSKIKLTDSFEREDLGMTINVDFNNEVLIPSEYQVGEYTELELSPELLKGWTKAFFGDLDMYNTGYEVSKDAFDKSFEHTKSVLKSSPQYAKCLVKNEDTSKGYFKLFDYSIVNDDSFFNDSMKTKSDRKKYVDYINDMLTQLNQIYEDSPTEISYTPADYKVNRKSLYTKPQVLAVQYIALCNQLFGKLDKNEREELKTLLQQAKNRLDGVYDTDERETYHAFCQISKDIHGTIEVERTSEYSMVTLRNNMLYDDFYGLVSMDSKESLEPVPLTIKEEKAKELANDMLEKLGLDKDFTLSYSFIVKNANYQHCDVSFVRKIADFKVECSDNANTSMEEIQMQVNDSGVYSLCFTDPLSYKDSVSEKSKLIDFEAAYEVFKTVDYNKFSAYTIEDEDTPKRTEINFANVRLSAFRVKADSNEAFCKILPVWIFESIPDEPDYSSISNIVLLMLLTAQSSLPICGINVH